MFLVSYESCDKDFTDTFLIFSYGEISLKFATVKVFELIFKSVFFFLSQIHFQSLNLLLFKEVRNFIIKITIIVVMPFMFVFQFN